jgi:hypothetical protein
VPGAGESVEDGLEAQQFGARHQRVDGGVLQRDTDVAPNGVGLVDDVVSGDRRRARRRPQQRGEHPDGGALAGAVRAEEAEDLAGLDGEIDAVDGSYGVGARSEVSDEIAGDDGWGLVAHHRRVCPITAAPVRFSCVVRSARATSPTGWARRRG